MILDTLAAAVTPYKVPFLTERDVAKPIDCAICSSLMAALHLTRGSITKQIPEWPNDLPVRERIRKAQPQAPDGGTFISANRTVLVAMFGLPFVSANLFNAAADVFAALDTGQAAIPLLGNPIGVKDPNSPFRTVQVNDDYGHVVCLVAHDKAHKRTLMLNPLRKMPMSFAGEWVPDVDVAQFASRFDRPQGWQSIIYRRPAFVPKPPPAPEEAMIKVVPNQRLVLPAGTQLFDKPNGTPVVPVSTSEPRTYGETGDPAWRAVEVLTQNTLVWVYVKAAVGSTVPFQPIPTDCTAAVTKAKQDQHAADTAALAAAAP